MRRFIFYFLILFLSIWLGLKMHQSPGYVLITYEDWAVETSLWVAVFAILISVIVLFKLTRLFSYLGSIPQRIKNWFSQRRRHHAQRLTTQGLRLLAEGHWYEAEKTLLKSVSESDSPLINYLAAANAAQGRKDVKKRDEYLHRALMSTDDAQVAVGLTQAELQLDTHELVQARNTLEHLNRIVPKHPQVLKLLQKVYVELGDWTQVQSLIPQLRRKDILTQEEMLVLEKQLYLALLTQQLPVATADQLPKIWGEVPRYLHQDPDILVKYTDALLAYQDIDEAEKLILKALNHKWDRKLIRQFAKVPSANPSKQLAHAESLLKSHPGDAALFVCLGKLCIRNRLWGKAQGYLVKARELEPSPGILHDLGQVYEHLDDKALAMSCYKQGLQLETSS
jgi:HemY protein